jgi:hypothetical protein
MKQSKIMRMALLAQEAGYNYIASIVKNVKFTNYYHIVSIKRILESGKWIPAQHVQFSSGAHGRIGQTEKSINWSDVITRARLSYITK